MNNDTTKQAVIWQLIIITVNDVAMALGKVLITVGLTSAVAGVTVQDDDSCNYQLNNIDIFNEIHD